VTHINYTPLNLNYSLPQCNKNIRITQEIITMWKGKPCTEDNCDLKTPDVDKIVSNA
jgi:hypothetical protein